MNFSGKDKGRYFISDGYKFIQAFSKCFYGPYNYSPQIHTYKYEIYIKTSTYLMNVLYIDFKIKYVNKSIH